MIFCDFFIRIADFLQAEEVKPITDKEKSKNGEIEIKNGEFWWDTPEDEELRSDDVIISTNEENNDEKEKLIVAENEILDKKIGITGGENLGQEGDFSEISIDSTPKNLDSLPTLEKVSPSYLLILLFKFPCVFLIIFLVGHYFLCKTTYTYAQFCESQKSKMIFLNLRIISLKN